MGGGFYSSRTRSIRAKNLGYDTKSPTEIFSMGVNSAMNPSGVKLRESRDSNEHPNSLAIILALDETGSMGSIPHHLVKEGLPKIMDKIISGGIKDPQVLFMGIGDHECDRAPLQIGQFESSDELLDHWLTKLYLEGGGGGNDGESYLLAWYFASKHTSIDCLEKRKQKGVLITIGDEPCLSTIPKTVIKKIMGDGQYDDVKAVDVLKKAQEKYHVFHLHLKEGYNGMREDVINGWRSLLGTKNLKVVNKKEEIPDIIADIVNKTSKKPKRSTWV